MNKNYLIDIEIESKEFEQEIKESKKQIKKLDKDKLYEEDPNTYLAELKLSRFTSLFQALIILFLIQHD